MLANSPSILTRSSHRIECMCVYSKGFVVAGKDCSIFVYKVTHNPAKPFEVTHTFTFKAFTDLKDLLVTGVAVTPH